MKKIKLFMLCVFTLQVCNVYSSLVLDNLKEEDFNPIDFIVQAYPHYQKAFSILHKKSGQVHHQQAFASFLGNQFNEQHDIYIDQLPIAETMIAAHEYVTDSMRPIFIGAMYNFIHHINESSHHKLKTNPVFQYMVAHKDTKMKLTLQTWLNKPCKGHNFLLHQAIQSHDISFIKFLITLGADVNVVDKKGQTPIFHALNKRFILNENFCLQCVDMDAIEVLLAYGADINHQDNLGNSLLHEAAVKNDSKFVTFLLEAGADCLSENVEGLTPLACVQIFRNKKVESILLFSHLPECIT